MAFPAVVAIFWMMVIRPVKACKPMVSAYL
jgi:hypothetical protein